jgi:hypothetical protein
MTKRILKVALAAVLLSAALACPVALAGRYHVYSCRTPSGGVAPADGWSGSIAAGGAWDDEVVNTCSQGGALVAALGDQTKHRAYVDRATWIFGPPKGSTLVSATLWRAGSVYGTIGEEASYQFWLAGPLLKDVFEECVYSKGCGSKGELVPAINPASRVVVPANELGGAVSLSVSCGAGLEGSECAAATGDANGYAAVLYLYAADLTLEQTAGPTASAVGGELANAPAVAGTSDLTFNATDPGAGVYEAIVSVDGNVIQRTVINEAGGRCREVGQTTDGLPAFLYLQPCPASVSADLPLDTTGLANGQHHLMVAVVDAAGNSAPVVDRNITVANPVAPGVPGPPNGQGASSGARLEARWKSTTKALLAGAYGQVRTITGRLLDPKGEPITGAQIEASATAGYAGAKAVTIAVPRTGSDGRFSLRLPASTPSQTVVISYRARLGDPTAAAGRTLKLELRAGISLTIRPRVSGVGKSISFHGRLLGGPIPRGGKPVVLEARAGKSRWIEFDVVRSDSHGRFHASYRFKFPGPVRYQFRVLCEREADYPYATGASNVVGVRER